MGVTTRGGDIVKWIAALALAMAIPSLFAGSYALGLMTETLIFGIAAMSLDLLMGYGGLVSFGHAAYFGLGAYGTVLIAVKLGYSAWISAFCGIAISTAAASVIGYFCVRMTGVAFLMLTLAFAQLVFSIAVKWRAIGGSDGVGGLAKPAFINWSLGEPLAMYLFTLATFAACFVAMRRVMASRFGHALVGLRENEMRMRAMGFPTQRIRWAAFIVAGFFAGVGGALYAFFEGFVSPDALSWGMSGMLLLMVVFGGAGSLMGPAIGAGGFLMMKHFVSSHTQHWLLVVGVIFVACVMFFRQGVWGMLRNRFGAGS